MRTALLLVLASSVFLSSTSSAANVDVPDKNLAKQLRKALKLADDAPLTTTDLEKLNSFKYDARNKNVITNLEGIQYATNLTSLNVRRNDISDITPLASLTKLKVLEIDSNKKITDLTPLQDLLIIERLNVAGTSISDLTPIVNIPTLSNLTISATNVSDLSPLIELKDLLQVLSFSSLPQLTTLEPLQHMTKLRTINMSSLPDLDLTPLSQVTSMRSITATRANFSDLSPLGALVDITFLNFEYGKMTSLDGLETLSKVTKLKLRRGSLVDISAMAGMTALQTLEMEENDVVDISPLAELQELVIVDLDKNDVVDVSPLANKAKLKTLSLRENNVSTIDPLVNLPLLETLDLEKNDILEIDNLANLPSLKTLNLNHNEIISITALQNLTSLQTLYISGNGITDISPATNIPTLVNLYAAQNLITELPSLTSLKDLKVLDLNKNQITDLSPVSVCTNLIRLFADENGVTTLGNWQNLTELDLLYLRKNQITDFSTIGHCAKLKEAYINDNPATILGDWSKLTILWKLYAYNCQLQDLSGLANCSKLKEIQAFSNDIFTLGNWSALTELQTLKLERNRIRDISTLSNCTALKSLYLTYNHINTLGDFSTLVALQTLRLNYNQLSQVHEVGGAVNLKELNLAFNSIEDIQFLENLTKLTRLELNNNLIQGEITLPDSLAKLTYFFLYDNQISEIHNTEALQAISTRGHELRLQLNFLDVAEGSPMNAFFAELIARNQSSNPRIISSPQFDPTIDYDNDALPSDWELLHKTNAIRANAQQDPDGDLYTNLEEFQNNTDPTDPESFPTFAPTAIQLSTNHAPENAEGLTIGTLYAHDLDSAGGFEAIPGELSWEEARKAAEDNGGHLATINSRYEERLLFTSTQSSLRNRQYWIGATNSATQGEWTYWVNGEPMLYYPWAKGEPNGGTGEPFLELYLHNTLPYTTSPYNTPQYFPAKPSKLDLVPGALESLAFLTYDISNLDLDQNQGTFSTIPTGAPQHYSGTLSVRSSHFYQSINNNFTAKNHFTAVFRGYFHADKAGTYEFGNESILGKMAFWIDLNQDGVFEHKGDQGYESMVKNWGTGYTTVELEAGYYPICILHTVDTGSAIILPTYKVPGGEHITIHPAEQTQHWFARPIEDFGVHSASLPWNDEFEPSRQGYILEKSPTFELVDGEGATHNESFAISNAQLKLVQPQDFEQTPTLSVRVKVTDRHDLSYEQILSISLEDVNEPSTNVGLSTTQTPEDRPAGSMVAIIFTEDPDQNDTFSYELVEGAGADDNAAFTIQDNQLLAAIVLDRETQATYSIRLRSTDAAGHQAETSFVIEALDMPENQPPTDISISTTYIKENQPTGTPLATFSSLDPDHKIFRGGIGTSSLVSFKYATYKKAVAHAEKLGGHPAVFTSQVEWDLALKQIGKENLIGKNILLGATDAEEEGTWVWVTEEPFTYDRWARNQNEPNNSQGIEHELIIWEGTGEELLWGDALLGKDANAPTHHYLLEQPVTYELVAGKGDTHNSFYRILGNKLLSEKPSNFEENSRHSIRVKVTDNGAFPTRKLFYWRFKTDRMLP